MAQGYKLVLRPSEPGVKDSKKLYYAVSKSTVSGGRTRKWKYRGKYSDITGR